MIDDTSEAYSAEKKAHHGTAKESTGGRSRVTIDVLPDVVLLNVFDFYLYEEPIEAWHTLVHVCRLWRNLVFGSPRRLNLRLECTGRTPAREMLDIWPLLPIVVIWDGGEYMDNVIAALEHRNRICQIDISGFPMSLFERTMQRPFPELTCLRLRTRWRRIPDSFLGGSAPRLQRLILEGVIFPGLPNLLSSATHLVHLSLWRIPDSGWGIPESGWEMATCLAMVTRLETLAIGFDSTLYFSDQKSQPSLQTLTHFPVLSELQFFGAIEHLEEIVARIDAPLLKVLAITFNIYHIFQTPHFSQFIDRTPNFRSHDEAYLVFSRSGVSVTFPQTFDGALKLSVPTTTGQSNQQLCALVDICNSSLPRTFIPAVEHLYIIKDGIWNHWQYTSNHTKNDQWLQLLRPFTAVKSLYISSEYMPRIADALQELVGERVREAFPALQNIFLKTPPSGPVQKTIGRFVSARQFSGHPVVISPWK